MGILVVLKNGKPVFGRRRDQSGHFHIEIVRMGKDVGQHALRAAFFHLRDEMQNALQRYSTF